MEFDRISGAPPLGSSPIVGTLVTEGERRPKGSAGGSGAASLLGPDDTLVRGCPLGGGGGGGGADLAAGDGPGGGGGGADGRGDRLERTIGEGPRGGIGTSL